MTSYKILIEGTTLNLALRSVGVLTNFLLIVMVSRKFGPAGLAVYALFMALLLPFSVLARLGLDTNLLRLVSKFNAKNDLAGKRFVYQQSIYVVLMFSLGLSVLLIGGSYFLSAYGWINQFPMILLWVALSIPLHALILVNVHYLRGDHRIGFATLFDNLLIYLIALILFLLFSTNDLTKNSIIYCVFASLCIVLALSFWKVSVDHRPLPASHKTAGGYFSSLRERFSEAIPMLGTSLSDIALQSADILILSLLVAASEVGTYSAGVKLVALVGFPLLAVNGMLAPKLSHADALGTPRELETVFKKSTRLAVWSGFPIAILIALFPDFFLGLFGEGFETGVQVVFILLVGSLANILVGPIAYLLWMTGNAVFLQYITLTTILLNVVLNFILIPYFGIVGAAIAAMSSLLVKSILCWILVRVRLGFSALYFPGQEVAYAIFRK